MNDVITSLKFKGNFNEFVEFLRTDKQFYYTKEDDLLFAFRDLCSKLSPSLHSLFNTLPTIPLSVEPMSARVAISAPSAYYYGPDFNGDRPGIFWVNTHKLESRPKYEVEALSMNLLF